MSSYRKNSIEAQDRPKAGPYLSEVGGAVKILARDLLRTTDMECWCLSPLETMVVTDFVETLLDIGDRLRRFSEIVVRDAETAVANVISQEQ